MNPRRALVTLAGLSLGLVPVVGCAGSDSDTTPRPVAADASTEDSPMIIDVRTPAEFAGGHLDGAVNIDIQSPDFVNQIEALDRNGSYVVYCRSGNRSGMAMAQMLDMGFTDVSNAGSVEEASASLGIAIIG